MRIGKLEVNVSNRDSSANRTIWRTLGQQPKRIEYMTPDELREALSSIVLHAKQGGKIVSSDNGTILFY